MAVSYAFAQTAIPGATSQGPRTNGVFIQQFWYVTSDLTGEVADVVTMADVLTGMNGVSSTQTDLREVLPGFSYILSDWILFRRNVTLDLRNTNLDILSEGSNSQTGGAGIVFRGYGNTATQVLNGGARATLITGNTLIIAHNRDQQRRIYGPFNRNSRWENKGGSTTILVDGGPRYDWGANETGTNDQTPPNFAELEFEIGHKVGVVSVTNVECASHLFIHPDSNPRNFEARDATQGGSIAATDTEPFTVYMFGGKYENLVFGGLLTGPVINKRAGLTSGDIGFTTEMRNVRSSSRTLEVNRRESFFDILGIVGSQREAEVDSATSINALNIVYIGDSAAARANYNGLFRLAYKWKPKWIGTDGFAIAHNHGSIKFDLILGTVTNNGFPAGVTDRTPPFMEEDDDFGVDIHTSNGSIAWTDPWSRSHPEPGRNDLVRDHVRLPWAWTRVLGDEADLGYYRADSATWQLFLAGYLPPDSPTDLTFPFESRDYGNWEGDIVIAYDEAFGTNPTDVLDARVEAKTDYDGAAGPTALRVYRAVMYTCEADATTAGDAWGLWRAIQPTYSGGVFRLTNSDAELEFNSGTAYDIRFNDNELHLPFAAVADEGYGSAVYIDFNGPIPNCTVDAPEIFGTVNEDNPINGLRVLQNCTLELGLNTEQPVAVNGITGETLTVSNDDGTAIIALSTDSGANIAVGPNVEITTAIEVRGFEVGTNTDPSRFHLYPLDGAGDPEIASAATATNRTEHVFDGLVIGTSYRFVWSRPGFDPVVHDFDSVVVGTTRQEFVPVPTANAAETSEIPVGGTIAVAHNATENRMDLTIQAGAGGLNGGQTNALFERAKGQAGFCHNVAMRNAVNLVLHPSLQESSLRNNLYHILGAESGVCSHVIQGVYEHRGNSTIIAGNAPDVEERGVEVSTGVTATLPEVIVYPGITNATIDAIGDIVSDAEDSIIAEIGDGGGGGQVTGFSDDATDDLIEAAIVGSQ